MKSKTALMIYNRPEQWHFLVYFYHVFCTCWLQSCQSALHWIILDIKHACLSLNNQTDTVLGWTLAKFNELKRNKRFDNSIMLVWVQGSLFHIAARSHPVHKAWGHKIVCTGVKFKSGFNVVKNHTNRFLLL